MVVDDLDRVGVAFSPLEADASRVVDSKAVLSGTDALERLQPIARGHAELLDIDRGIEQQELARTAYRHGSGKVRFLPRRPRGAAMRNDTSIDSSP